jgi:hypothetical protein
VKEEIYTKKETEYTEVERGKNNMKIKWKVKKKER